MRTPLMAVSLAVLLAACNPPDIIPLRHDTVGGLTDEPDCPKWSEPIITMPHDTIIRSAGLYTNVNPFDAPDGAMLRADDVVVDQLGVTCPRRGQATDGTLAAAPRAWGLYKSTLFAALANNTVVRYAGGVGTNLGTFVDPPNGRRRFAEAAQNLFFSAFNGTRRIDGAAGSPVQAGLTQPLDELTALVTTAVGAAVVGGRSVVYRYVRATKDSTGRIIRSAPSDRIVVTNYTLSFPAGSLTRAGAIVTGTYTAPVGQLQVGDVITLTSSDANFPSGAKTLTAFTPLGPTSFQIQYGEAGAAVPSVEAATAVGPTRDVTLQVFLVPTPAAGEFLEVYRSPSVDEGVTPPDALLGKVYETSGVIGGAVTVTDRVPDVLVGDRLYTAIEGIAQANTPPPIAGDVVRYGRHLVLANITEKQRLHVRLLAVGAPNGLQNGNVITIAGRPYTAGVNFIIETSGTVARNIELTSRRIVARVNQDAVVGNQDVFGRYVSGDNDAPGMMVFEAISWGAVSFSMTASANGAAWEPVLPVAGPAVSSFNSPVPNGLRICKADEPDHCPLENEVLVGSPENQILRIAALDDTLFVFTTKGFYWIRWRNPDLSDLDSDVFMAEMSLVATESVVRLGDYIYALTNFGLVRIGERGLEHISEPVDDQILALYASYGLSLPNAHAVAYPTDKKYLLWLPVVGGDGSAQVALVWNDRTKTWTRRTDPAAAGIVAADDKLILGTSAAAVTRERKARTDADYFNPDTNAPFNTVMEWLANPSKDPTTDKDFKQVSLHFLEQQSGTFTMDYQPDNTGSYHTAVETQGDPSAIFRAWTLDEARRASRMTFRVTRDARGKKFNLAGVGVDYDVVNTNAGAARQ